ncbi:MAG TPA: hypothetical protein VMW83_06075 [Spirochaetia bacterium]|nr:hypothetical protein [Spirochaetia bacterium]
MTTQTTLRVRLPEICLPDTVFTPVPPTTSCTPPPAGSTVSCNVSGVTCTEVSRTNSSTVSGLQDVKFLITFTLNLNIINPAGIIVCQTSQTSEFFQTVTLYAPPWIPTFCVATFDCGPCIALDDTTCCSLEVCLTVWTFVPQRSGGRRNSSMRLLRQL